MAKQKKKILINDQGVEEKRDIVGTIIVCSCSFVIILLVLLAIMAYLY